MRVLFACFDEPSDVRQGAAGIAKPQFNVRPRRLAASFLEHMKHVDGLRELILRLQADGIHLEPGKPIGWTLRLRAIAPAP